MKKYTKAMLVVGSNLYLPTCCSLARFSNTTMYRDEYFSSHTTCIPASFAGYLIVVEQKKRSSNRISNFLRVNSASYP